MFKPPSSLLRGQNKANDSPALGSKVSVGLEEQIQEKKKVSRKKDPRNFKSTTLPMNEAEYGLLEDLASKLNLSMNEVLRLGLKALYAELATDKAPEEIKLKYGGMVTSNIGEANE